MEKYWTSCISLSFFLLLSIFSFLYVDGNDIVHTDGKQVIRSFLISVGEDDLQGVKKIVSVKEREKVVMLDKKGIALKMKIGNQPLTNFKVEDREKIKFMKDRGGLADGVLTLRVKVEKQKPRYYVFYLRKEAGDWKVLLEKTLIQSYARFFQHPDGSRKAPSSEKWKSIQSYGLSTQTTCDFWQNRIVTGTSSGTVHIWNRNKKHPKKSTLEFSRRIEYLNISDASHRLLIKSGPSVQVWNVKTKERIIRLQKSYDAIDYWAQKFRGALKEYSSIDLSDDGEYVATSYSIPKVEENIITVWNVSKKKKRTTMKYSGSAKDIAISRNGNRVCLLTEKDAEERIHFWNLREGSPKESIKIPDSKRKNLEKLVFSKEQNELYILGLKHLVRYQIDASEVNSIGIEKIERLFHGLDGRIPYFKRIPGSNNVVIPGSKNEAAVIYSGKNLRKITTIQAAASDIRSVGVRSDSEILLGMGNKVRLWDRKKRKDRMVLDGFLFGVDHVDYLSDQSTAVTVHEIEGTGDEILRIWDVEQNEQIRSKTFQNVRINGIDSSDDEKTLAITLRNNKEDTSNLMILDTGNWTKTEQVTSSKRFSKPLMAESHRIFFGHGSDAVQVFDTKTNQIIKTYELPQKLQGTSKEIKGIALSPDEKYLAASLVDDEERNDVITQLILWNRKNGRWIKTSNIMDGDYPSIIFSNSSDHILIGGLRSPVTQLTVPNMKTIKQILHVGAHSLQQLDSKKVLFARGFGVYPQQILHVSKKKTWTLPNVQENEKVNALDYDPETQSIFGGSHLGRWFLWKKN